MSIPLVEVPLARGTHQDLWSRSCKAAASRSLRLGIAVVALVAASAADAQLLGADIDTGRLYAVSTSNASLSLIGSTGMTSISDIGFTPNGTLYGFTTSGGDTSLYRINAATAASTYIGALGLGFLFEGGLAIASNTRAYATNAGGAEAAQLFSIDLTTGRGTSIGVISGGTRDVNGLALRSDGMLIGLDRVSNDLIVIDPLTAFASVLGVVPGTVGAVGALTLTNGSQGYFSTSGPQGSIPGSNSLYSFDAFTGASTRIGAFSGVTLSTGISGLAAFPSAVPEPAGWAALLAGLATVAGIARRRHAAGRAAD